MAFDQEWPTRRDGTLHLAVVDSETTGIDPEMDEVICLSVLCVRVDRLDGRFLGVVGSEVEWQEPDFYFEEAQAITEVPMSSLAGRRFDRAKVDAPLAQTDLVVAHNAVFEWAFLTPLFPALGQLRWACSLDDIDWSSEHNVSHPLIANILEACGHEPHDGSPADACNALVKVLSQPLPRSSETGFCRLIAASARVTVVCDVPETELTAHAGLQALGFELQDGYWTAVTEDAAAAFVLETRVIDLAVDDQAFEKLLMRRVDAVNRFGSTDKRSPPS